ncbi:MAG: hypothetical protein PHO02_01230 [Candidatus Nanoarchaeia archaeon]|nr:hypothetical protein [Candidatus Nanoarchaeia archaeon]
MKISNEQIEDFRNEKKRFESALRQSDRKVRNAMKAIEESSKEFERTMLRIRKAL